MDRKDLLAQIENADMVLVGLGEDFDQKAELMQDARYVRGCEILQEKNAHWLIPAWNSFCIGRNSVTSAGDALFRLAELLKDKNYFVVSVSTNSSVMEIPWKHKRLVMPCGSAKGKQCLDGCGQVLMVDESDEEKLRNFFEQLYEGTVPQEIFSLLGTCPQCSKALVLNNIYAENYNESGYLEKWSTYMKWLQGTINRKVLILELGVGLQYPSVIRWPFEKVAFYNQKSYFCRVHEKIYHLPPELTGKGCGISQNAIEWLRRL